MCTDCCRALVRSGPTSDRTSSCWPVDRTGAATSPTRWPGWAIRSTAPGSPAPLEPGRAALVVTVHDLLWRRVPSAYPTRGRLWHEAALRRALARAHGFIVPADVVAEDLCHAGARRDAITVIPMGSDHLPPPDRAAAAALLARLGIDGPFLLSVGTLEPVSYTHLTL